MKFFHQRRFVLEEHKQGQNFALNTSSRNFTEVIMFANKAIPENLGVVH